MKYLFLLVLCVSIFACDNSNSPTVVPQTIGDATYLLEAIPNSTAQLATQEDANGVVIASGQVVNNLKNGTWLTFDPEKKDFPKTLTTYIDGIKNGPYFEFNDRGQIQVTTNFKNDQYHGKYAKYRFSRPEEEREYKDGQLHGVYKTFFQRTGKLQKEMTYKDGQLDGPYRFYNEDGQVTVEYSYKNGAKVSGGIIDSTKVNPPK